VIGVYIFQFVEGEWFMILFDFSRIVIVSFLITLLVFIGITRKIVAPIKQLTKIAKKVNVTNMDIPLIGTEHNEIGELANQFRQMSMNLKYSIAEIKNQKEILEFITNSVHQAIWIVDENTRVINANQNFANLISGIDYKNQFMSNLLRNHEIIKLFHDTVAEKTHINREIEHFGTVNIITSTYLTSNKCVIFTLLDISDIKTVEKFKRDLISNVSHELKTPLTSIKGFVETLLSDANDEQIHYLEIVNRNTDRLIGIINNLLSLSKLEQTKDIQLVEISVKNLLANVQKQFVETLQKHNITLTYEIIPNDLSIYADEFILEQVFVNLIDNSIKYSGSPSIEISTSTTDRKVIFTIADTGIGIPIHHQNRIFERFYTVDKSRSKRIGGTGLGLAIVKHIIHLHGGEISVESDENLGTKFIFWLPI
jgi:two-component system phosphate regulon sensor histidine kinase PhoR